MVNLFFWYHYSIGNFESKVFGLDQALHLLFNNLYFYYLHCIDAGWNNHFSFEVIQLLLALSSHYSKFDLVDRFQSDY